MKSRPYESYECANCIACLIPDIFLCNLFSNILVSFSPKVKKSRLLCTRCKKNSKCDVLNYALCGDLYKKAAICSYKPISTASGLNKELQYVL